MLTPILNRFIYQPNVSAAPATFTPDALALTYEEVALRTQDGVALTAWYIVAQRAHGMLLYLHGNAGNRRDWVGVAPHFVSGGYSVLILDYRGYGANAGRPSEAGLYMDGAAGWAWLEARARREGVPAYILGKSLGSGVATYLAAQHTPAGLILDSAYTSMSAVIGDVVPWLPRGLIPRLFDSLARVERIACPTLVVHGDKDQLIHWSHGLKLYARLKAPKALQVMRGMGHNTVDAATRYYPCLMRFMRDPVAFTAEARAESEAVLLAYKPRL